MYVQSPIPYNYIDYGALALVVIIIIGFAYRMGRSAAYALRRYPQVMVFIPLNERPKPEGYSAGSVLAGLVKAVGDALIMNLFSACQAENVRGASAKRAAKLMILWGFILLAITTILAYVLFPKNLIPVGFGGGPDVVVVRALGVIGGFLALAGSMIWLAVRNAGAGVKMGITFADYLVIVILLTVLTGFALQAAIALAPGASALISALFYLHIAFVVALFAPMPFTKFDHAVYRLFWLAFENADKASKRLPRLPEPEKAEVYNRSAWKPT